MLFFNSREISMQIAQDREILMRLDSPEAVAAGLPAQWMKAATRVALILVLVCAVLAVEIELLHSGALVVLMPE
jgi:hypothetical protein